MNTAVLVELIYDDGEHEPHVCSQEGIWPDEESAKVWVLSNWPNHKDHGHIIEIMPPINPESPSIFVNFVTLPFGRGWADGVII